jgi:hypothetical protein
MAARLLASFVAALFVTIGGNPNAWPNEARVSAILRLIGGAILLVVIWLPLTGCSTTRTLIHACRDGLCR